jgi:hypothetical protein
MDDGMINPCGAIGRMTVGKGKRSTWRKFLPVSLRPLQTPHYLTCDRTRAADVGIRRLTARVVLCSDTGMME